LFIADRRMTKPDSEREDDDEPFKLLYQLDTPVRILLLALILLACWLLL
jgi:hypothetical protein